MGVRLKGGGVRNCSCRQLPSADLLRIVSADDLHHQWYGCWPLQRFGSSNGRKFAVAEG
jgi:hypothetical protein